MTTDELIEQTECNTWFERDRQHVELRDLNSDKTIVEFWDEDVTQMIEDGYLKPANYHRSIAEYCILMQIK